MTLDEYRAQNPPKDGEPRFEYVIRTKREWEATEKATEESVYADAIPDLGDDEKPVFDNSLKEYIKGLDVIEVIQRFTVKEPKPTTAKMVDGNKFRCPWPEHPDVRPDAWFNRDKRTWFCGPCGCGGDNIELIAAARGYTRPGQKVGADTEAFSRLMNDLKTELGWVEEEPTLSGPVAVPVAATGAAQTENATIEPELEMHYDDGAPALDLSAVLPGGQDFISVYCGITGEDSIAPVFNFASAALLVSAVMGRNVQIKDGRNVFGNIAVILTGDTGAGKTRATWHCTKVLREALGEDPLRYEEERVRIIKDPGSDEYLVDQHIEANTSGSVMGPFIPVRSLIQFNELSKLMAQSRRQGSTILERVFDLLDAEEYIETGSRGKGKLVAKHAYASLLSTTQPTRLHKVFTGDDASFGAANRLHFYFGEGVATDIIAENAQTIDLTAAVQALRNLATWVIGNLPDPTRPVPAGEPLLLKWAPEAVDELNAWGRDWLTPRRQRDESNLLNRLDLHVKKYALLFAVNAMSLTIEPSHVQAAITVAEYLYKGYVRVDSRLGRTDDTELADVILEAIDKLEKAGKPVTQREIYQRVRRRAKNNPVKVEMMLRSLTALGVIRAGGTTGNASGPKSATYKKTA